MSSGRVGDKQQLEPMLAKINALPKNLGKADVMLGDNCYFSAANVTACLASGIEPLLALARDAHHQSLRERSADAPLSRKPPVKPACALLLTRQPTMHPAQTSMTKAT